MVVPPPLIYLPAVVLGFVTKWFWPVVFLPDTPQYAVGGLFVVVSLGVVPRVLREFRKAVPL